MDHEHPITDSSPDLHDYDTYLFDLDGTLSDPEEGITSGITYALSTFGIVEPDPAVFRSWIGPPLHTMFKRHYGFDDREVRQLITNFRSYFDSRGIFENVLYEGIEQMLCRLRQQKKQIMLATSKPEPFARRILEHFHIISYFDYIGANTFENVRPEKIDVIAHVMERHSLSSQDALVMVGDRSFDVASAQKLGIDAIGVTYGFGTVEELRAWDPIALIHSPAALGAAIS
jgi:phosphoglycolate phosphatase